MNSIKLITFDYPQIAWHFFRRAIALFCVALTVSPVAWGQSLENIWAPYFKYHTADTGMSQSFANIIFQDENEFVWLVTQAGVDRFNGYEFQSIPFDGSVAGNPQGNIIALLSNAEGNIIAVSKHGDVFIFDKEVQAFSLFFNSQDDLHVVAAQIIAKDQLILYGMKGFQSLDLSAKLPLGQLSSFSELSKIDKAVSMLAENDELLWITTENDKLYSFNQKSNRLVAHIAPGETAGQLRDNLKLTVAIDGGVFAIFQSGSLYKASASIAEMQKISLPKQLNLPQHKIEAIVQTSSRYLWLTTQGSGLFQIDLANTSARQFKAQSTRRGTLSSNNLYGMFFDKQQQLWISAPNGINYAQVEKMRFYQIGGNRAYTQPLSSLSVYDLCGDENGNLWVGTHDAGVDILNLKENSNIIADSFPLSGTQFKSPNTKKVGNKRFVTSLGIDPQQVVWVGYPDSLEWYSATTLDALEVEQGWREIGLKGISSIFISQQDKIVTTRGNDIYFQSGDAEILHFMAPLGVSSKDDLQHIVGPLYDSYWISSGNSAYVLEFNRVTHVITPHLVYDSAGIPLAGISALWISPGNELWLGTNGQGIVRKVLNSDKTTWLDTHSGLADNNVYAILGDGLGYIWVTGNKGLTRISTKSGKTQIFTVEDGLQSNEFNSPSAFRSQQGLLYFGGINGITVVDENNFSLNRHIPKTYIQDAMLLTSDGARKLKLVNGTTIEPLDYHSNSLLFKIGTVDLLNSKANYFSYRLLGNNADWVDLGNNRNINFLNLSAGNYQLEVMSCNGDDICNPIPRAIKFYIPPPPWLSFWAYTFYVLLFLFVIYYFVNRQHEKLKYQRQVAEKERRIANELRELNTLKDEFLTNTSHELRTPLNGIIGLSQFLKSEAASLKTDESLESLEAINHCGLQLQDLVDDLLDYSQLTNKRLILKRSPFNINNVIELIVMLLQPQCARKNLTLSTDLVAGAVMVNADENRIRQVISNLVSNAIKFSDSGTITVSTKIKESLVKVTVIDQGIGIPTEFQKKIFLSFAQLDGSNTRNRGGLGLGLAISKDIIELHGSQLELISEERKGTEFSFSLPV